MANDNPDAVMPLLAHLAELRKRLVVSCAALIVATAVCYGFYDAIYAFLSRPFADLPTSKENTLFVTSVFEGFLVRLKLSIYAGLVFSTPVHVWNAIGFVFPALKPVEKKVVGWSLLASSLLIAASGWYIYSLVLPFSVKYLVGSQFLPKGVGVMLHYGQNLNYIFMILFFGMVIFQLPIVMALLLRFGVLKRGPLLRYGRYVIVGIFVFSAVVTPPDYISQLSLAIPLVVFYYLTLLVAKIFGWGNDVRP
ncbi:MAG: twin-arginine translocase subunit TatC [Spirochaetes bacterium]|nr:twin-arginine translocase subunit TatC [Spirochaetota bacterium]